MPAELIACLFISGFALMIGLTVYTHRQNQKVIDLMKRQKQRREFLHGVKRRIDSDFSNDLARVGRLDQRDGDSESEFDN